MSKCGCNASHPPVVFTSHGKRLVATELGDGRYALSMPTGSPVIMSERQAIEALAKFKRTGNLSRSHRSCNMAGGKPFSIVKDGSKFALWMNVPMVWAYGPKMGANRKKWLEGLPQESVPLVAAGKGVDFVPGGKPKKMTKDSAMHLAHQAGRYFFGWGDFVHTYVEGL